VKPEDLTSWIRSVTAPASLVDVTCATTEGAELKLSLSREILEERPEASADPASITMPFDNVCVPFSIAIQLAVSETC
jgi:hypothetical protein